MTPKKQNSWAFRRISFEFLQSRGRRDSPEQASTFILDTGTAAREYICCFQSICCQCRRDGISSKKPRNINRSQQNFQMDFVLMASLYAKLKGG